MNPLIIAIGLVLTGAGIAAKNPAEKSTEKVLTKKDNSIIKEVQPIASETNNDDSETIDSSSDSGTSDAGDLDLDNEPE